MASFDVIVKLVDQTKSSMKNIEGGLKNVEQQAAKTNKALGNIGNALVAIGTSAAAAKIVEVAKNFGDLEARIRATSGSGTQTANTMNYLLDTANRLGVSVQDVGKAFSILRANGIDASYKSLETWTKLAISSGKSTEDIADAIANAYQGSFGKISKATEDLIQVENKYGSFIVKFRGVVVDTVGTSGQAVEAIRKFTEQNAAFADAFDAKSKGTTAALNRLNNAITGNTGFGQLDKSIGGAIDKFTNFITATDGIGKALGYVTKAVNFLGDNFETILTIVEIVGSIFLVGKLFQGLKLIGSLAVGLGNSIRSLGYFFLDFKSNIGKAISYITTAWKSWYTQITGGSQTIVGVFDAVARVIGVTLGTIIKNIGSLLQSFAAPFTAVIAYVTGLFDPLLDKLNSVYEGVKKFIGLGGKINAGTSMPNDQSAAETARLQRQNASLVPPAPGSATGTSNPGVPGNTFLQDIIGNLGKAKSEIKPLEKALANALNKGDLSLAAKLFEELSSRAEQFGNVIEKDSALITRDFTLSLNKSNEELRQQSIRLDDALLMATQFEQELRSNGLALQEQEMKLADATYMTTKFGQELKSTALGLDEQGMKLNDAAYMAEKFSLELRASQQSLIEQQMKLNDASYMAEKFKQEVLASSQALLENALRLKDSYYQNAKFEDSLIATRQGVEQQKITLDLLNKSYADGKITLLEYSNALGQVDAALLNSDQVLNQALGTAQREVDIAATRLTALEKLNAEFRAGTVDAKKYKAAAGALGGDTEDIDRAVNVYGTFKDKLIENNEYIKKSIKGAANTFSKEFTEAFVQAKNPLEAFKNFFGNILSDIANRMVKQHLADPLSEALIGMAEQVIGSKGDGKVGTIMTEGMNATGDDIVDTMKSVGSKLMDVMGISADGISDIFSGMSDSLGDMFSGLFDWIMDGIGSIGSSMGGLGGGGDMFGGIISSIGSFLGFADGGRPPVGQASLVGENGPELFVPDSGGTIVPNDQMGSGSNDPLVVNFNLNAIDTMTGTQFLLQNKPAIISMVGEAYNKRGRRGPLD